MAGRHNAFQRLFRGETSFDFCGRWRRWFTISGVIIVIGLISLATRGLNFSIDFKGGTVWEVPSTASVSEARSRRRLGRARASARPPSSSSPTP